MPFHLLSFVLSQETRQLENHNTEAYDGDWIHKEFKITNESYQINIKFHSKNNYLCMSPQCYDSHSVLTGGTEQQDEKSEIIQVQRLAKIKFKEIIRIYQ